MNQVHLQAMGVVCALGMGAAAVREALFSPSFAGVVETDRYTAGRPLHLGVLPAEVAPLDRAPQRQRSRNNAVLAAALADIRPQVDAAIARFGPRRVAIVLGVSTAGVEEGERASRLWQAEGRWPEGFDYALQEMGNAAEWLAGELGTCGPASRPIRNSAAPSPMLMPERFADIGLHRSADTDSSALKPAMVNSHRASTPPATTASTRPAFSRRAPEISAFAPDEQAVEITWAGPQVPSSPASHSAALPISCSA